jgi:hypothetical protein
MLALLLAALALPVASAGAAPVAQSGLAVAAHAGFGDDGSYVIGEWFPVRVTLDNPAGAPSLRVRVEVDSMGQNDVASGSYGRDVDLPAQSHKILTLYAYASGFSHATEVRVLQGSTIIKKVQVNINPLEPSQQMVVGVISSDASLLNVLKGEHAGHQPVPFANKFGGPLPNPTMQEPAIAVAHMSLSDIPAVSTALNSLSAMVLEDTSGASGGLSDEQTQALIAWVARGGTLIVAPRPGGSDVPQALAGLLPVKIVGNRNLTGFQGLADMVDVPPIVLTTPIAAFAATLRTEPSVGARELASQDGMPLAAVRSLGEGQVAFLALPPDVSPLKNWDGIVPVFKRLLVEHRMSVSPGAMLNQMGASYSGGSFAYVGGFPGAGALFAMFTNIFELPGLDLPEPILIALFTFLYIVLIGPVNFIILRRRRRPELAWATVPALVLIFSVAAYVLGYGAKGGDLVTIRAKLAHSAPEVQAAQAMEAWGIFSPNRGTYRLNISADSVVSQINRIGGAGSNTGTAARVSGGNGATSVDNLNINTGSLEGFTVENTVKAGSPLEADLHLDGDSIVGTLRNRTGAGLQDVALVRGDAVQYIGYIGGANSAQVKLPVSSGVFSNDSPVSILPPPPGVTAPNQGNLGYGFYSGGGSSSSAEQRRYNRKVHMLNLGLGPLLANEPPTDMDVIALAWGADIPIDLTVDGHTDRAEDLSLWTTRLHLVQHAGDRPQLKSGVVPYDIYVPRNNPAWLATASNTNITLQPYADLAFRLPAGTKPDSLNLSVAVGSSSGDVDLLAYNVRKGAWDRLGSLGNSAQATNFTTPIPNPADYTGPAGDVTLRLLSTTGKTDLNFKSVDLSLNQGGA